MSKFLGLSKEKCIALEEIELERPLTCPDCIPDLSAPNIDWLSATKPYFDPRTCEYIINHLASKKVQGLKTSLADYVKSEKIAGARKLLKHFNKQIFKNMGNPSSDGYKKVKTSRRNVVVDRSNLIRIRIAIDAVDFNKLPDRVVDPNKDTPPDNSASDLPAELLLDDEDGEFNINFVTSCIALRGYEIKQELFMHTKGALIRKDSKDEFIIFKFNQFIDKIKDFKEKLEGFLSDNGFDFLSPLSLFSFNRKVQNLRIELDNSDEKKPLKIKKVFAKAEGCPETELLIGLPNFTKTYMPEAVFFFANFEKIFSDVTTTQTKDWLEFVDEYVYPPVYVDYGESPEDEKISESNPNCPAIKLPFGDILENLLKDLTLGLADLFALEMDRNSCNPDPKKSNPTLKQFMNPVKQREFEKAYRRELRIRKEAFKEKIRGFDTPLNKNPNETEEDYQNRLTARKEEKEAFLARLDRESQQTAEFVVSQDQINNPDKYNPLYDQWQRSTEAKFKSDNSIFSIWEKIQEADDLVGEFTKFQTYIDLIGLCGLNQGMQSVLDCLFKQVSFEDAFQAAISVAFEVLPPDFFESTFLPGLTPIQQTNIRNKVANKLGTNMENVKWPWENRNTNKQNDQQAAQEGAIRKQFTADLKEDIEKGDEEAYSLFLEEYVKHQGKVEADDPEYDEKVSELTYKALEDKQVNKQLARDNTDISRELNEIGGEIIKAYVDVLFEYFSIDDLLETFKSVPMVALLTQFGLSFKKCPTKVLKDLEQNKIKEFKLDICNPTAPVINIKIPQIDFSTSPLKIVTENITKIIRETIVRVLSRLVGTILKLLEDALCKLAELAGKMALRPDQFFGDLPGTFRQAFCPDASDDEALEMGNNLLNKVGLEDDQISSAMDCLGAALVGSFTQDELISLMVDEKPSPSLLDRVADAVTVSCPRFADAFGDRKGAANIFNNLRDLLPQHARDRLRDLSSIPNNMPLYETICLTSEELENWDNLRNGNLQSAGLSPEEAQEQVENYNQRALDALRDAMKDLTHGPDQTLADALEDLFSPNPERPPGCDLKNGESNFGSKAIKEPESLVQVQDELSNRIMDIIGDSFDREYASNPNPFNPSLLHRIMRDTEGNDYGNHRFRESFLLTRMDYHDSETSEALKEAAPWWAKSFGLDDMPFGEDKGYFPETIGKDLEVQATSKSTYETKKLAAFIPLEYEVPFNASYLYAGGSYGHVGYVSDTVVSGVDDTAMDYSIELKKYNLPRKQIRQSVIIEDDIKEVLNNYGLDAEKRKRKIFADFIAEKLLPLQNKPEIDLESLFDQMCEKVFNTTKTMVFADSEGLLFGYEEEDLTENELKYVGPNGEDPYTNYFTEEDRTLGRALEPTNRVFFLDPDQFGGSYQTPPVYIKPKKEVGWMKISSVLSPEKSPCPPEADSVVAFTSLKTHVNNVRNSMNVDPRLSNSVEKCFIEKPFDKILSKNAASCIDGICRMHIRMSISKVLTQAIPVLGNIKYSEENFGNVFSGLIYDEMQKELSEVNPFWPAHIKTHIYEMLVYEQIVQSYEREVIVSLPPNKEKEKEKDLTSLAPDEQKAWTNITTIRENYSYQNAIVSPTAVEKIPSISTLGDPFSSDLFAVYGIAYKKWGEKIFAEDFEFNWSGVPTLPGFPPTPILPFVDYKTFATALAVRLVKDDVQVIVKKVIDIEVKKVIDHFYNQFEPKIENLPAFLLTSQDLFYSNSIQNFGTTDYYNKINLGSVATVGEANDVIADIKSQTPWGYSKPDEVSFKIEKFVRFVKKEQGGNQALNRPGPTSEEDLRDYLGKQGVKTIEKAQEFIDLQKNDYGDLYITDLFGNAEIEDGSGSYIGHIGISYGLRIVMKVPESLMSSELSEFAQKDVKFSKAEKAYYCNTQALEPGNSNNFSIPIVSREIELKDKLISEIDFSNGDDSYDLRCLLEKLEKSVEYRLLFKYLCPTRAVSSMMLAYSNNFFIESIGVNDGWAGEEGSNLGKKKPFGGEWDHLVGGNFPDTAKTCRKYFSSFYYSTKFIHDENWNLPKLELPDFMKLLFGSFSLPELNLSIKLPEFEFDHKIITKNPLNKNDEVCEEPVDKFLS